MSYAVSRYLTLWLRDVARVKYPYFTLAHHRVSSSSVVRAPVLDHGRSWVPIPVGSIVTPFIYYVLNILSHSLKTKNKTKNNWPHVFYQDLKHDAYAVRVLNGS